MHRLLVLLFILLPFGSPAEEKPRYLFFLHNNFLELAGLNDTHPDYGKCEYYEIIKAFEKEGFVVITELRPGGTNGDEYARKVKKQVDSLLSRGVAATEITVVGTSKGAYIAWKVSSLLRNSRLNFVLIGICSEKLINENPADDLYGNVLSIYETSDDLGKSCSLLKNRSGDKIIHYKEIALSTGRKHGFLYKALPQWVTPSVSWAKGNYR